MKQTLLSLLLSCIFIFTANAQKGKTFFNTFEVAEINTVQLQIPDDIIVEKWVNKTSILIETNVSLTNVSDPVYKHHMKSGRYDLTELDDEGTELIIAPKRPNRPVIDGVEYITVTVYIPEEFELVNEKTLVRKLPTDEATSSTDEEQ